MKWSTCNKNSVQVFRLQPIKLLPSIEITNHIEMDDHIVIQPHKSQQNKDLLQALRLIGCSELHLRDRADHSNSHWWVAMLAWEWPGNGGSHRSWRSVELRKIFPHFPHQHFLFSTRLQDLYGLAYNFCYNTTTFSKEDQWELGGGQFGALFQVTFYYISIPAIVQRSNSGECVQ